MTTDRVQNDPAHEAIEAIAKIETALSDLRDSITRLQEDRDTYRRVNQEGREQLPSKADHKP